MNDLQELLKDTKEDAPVSNKVFRNFIDNHFSHLKSDVAINRKLLWIILISIIAAAVADRF